VGLELGDLGVGCLSLELACRQDLEAAGVRNEHLEDLLSVFESVQPESVFVHVFSLFFREVHALLLEDDALEFCVGAEVEEMAEEEFSEGDSELDLLFWFLWFFLYDGLVEELFVF